MEKASSTRTTLLTVFVTISLVLVFLTAFTKYIFAKDYLFYIEASCDAAKQTCFVRDCDDYCPPNGLDVYQSYYITAADFEACTTNSCENVCQNDRQATKCEAIPCDSTVDSCSDPEE